MEPPTQLGHLPCHGLHFPCLEFFTAYQTNMLLPIKHRHPETCPKPLLIPLAPKLLLSQAVNIQSVLPVTLDKKCGVIHSPYFLSHLSHPHPTASAHPGARPLNPPNPSDYFISPLARTAINLDHWNALLAQRRPPQSISPL